MIHDIVIEPLKQMTDDRGKVMHMLRNDSPIFENFGEILSSILIFDARGRSTGIAELVFADEAAAFEALAMHGIEMYSFVIKVEVVG